jgi:hypothetical protein
MPETITIMSLIDRLLYRPQSWTDDRIGRRAAGVPQPAHAGRLLGPGPASLSRKATAEAKSIR